MAGRIVLVDVSTVREGRLEDVKARMAELAEFVARTGTRAIAYELYLSADERQMTVIQNHPDSESVETQMTAAAPVFATFADLLTMSAMDIYGEPSDSLLDVLRGKADLLGLGRPPTLHKLEAGFVRRDR